MASNRAGEPMGQLRSSVCALLIVAGCLGTGLSARESNGTPAAKAAFAEGEAAARAGNFPEAAAAFRKAITADPDFVEAHQRFIDASQRQNTPEDRAAAATRLKQMYERWAREQPKRAVYPWALGVLTPDIDAADALFKKALAIDPAFARANFQVAKNADQRGDFAAQLPYLKKAVDSNPEEPRYLLRFAYVQRNSDPARFRELAQQVVDKFPTSPSAAEALYDLAEEATGAARRAYFDRLRANYPVDRYNNSAAGMNALYGDLSTPRDALALAREVAKALPSNRTWQQRAELQDAMTRAEALVAERRFADALAALDKTQRPSGNHGVTWTLLRADAAAGAGLVDQAYATLIDAAVIAPDARIEAALSKYGSASKKSAQDIEADVWRARDAKATVAPLFELPTTRGGAPVKLADYRGKLVVVAFWYPT
jgi:tetratricopeptide (TPR) repeat protein